jgi:RNA polymerase sigma factor (sigma-70 family)
MPLTRPSIFLRLHLPNNTSSWQEFAATYSGVVNDFARVYGRSEHDRKDIVQNVWLVLCRIMPKFQYQPDRGGFRHLLRRIVKTTAIDWLRRQGPVRAAQAEVMQLASQPAEDVALVEQRSVLQRSLGLARQKSSQLAWTCFERHVLERQAAKQVALELGLSANAVYVNASRVLDRVRMLCIEAEQVACHE